MADFSICFMTWLYSDGKYNIFNILMTVYVLNKKKYI